jgi:uncharacterized protein
MSAISTPATPGDFVWHDVLGHDPKGTAAFYADVMGWTTQSMEVAGATHTLLVGPQGPVAGATPLPEMAVRAGIPPHWASNVLVADVDAAARAAETRGGRIVFPAADFPEIGRLAGVADPTGGSLHVYTPGRPAPRHDARLPGNFAWAALATADPAAAFEFYAALFGWQRTRTLADGAGLVFGNRDAGELGAIIRQAAAPPAWVYFTRIADLDAARARAEARGAKVIAEAPHAPGRALRLLDPQGAAFGLLA